MDNFLSINKKYFNIGLKSIDILILSQIEEYQRNNCECYITNQQFSDMFGESVSTIKRSIDKLEQKGMLERKTRSRTDNGKKSKERTLNVVKVHNEPIKENKKENKKDNNNNNDFNRIIDALSNKGIDATMEDIIRGYKFSKDLKKKPWTVDEMVRFINRENQEGFYEYVNAF